MKTVSLTLKSILIAWVLIQAGGFMKSQLKLNKIEKRYAYKKMSQEQSDVDIKFYMVQSGNYIDLFNRLDSVDELIANHTKNDSLPFKTEINEKPVEALVPEKVTIKKADGVEFHPDTLPKYKPKITVVKSNEIPDTIKPKIKIVRSNSLQSQ